MLRSARVAGNNFVKERTSTGAGTSPGRRSSGQASSRASTPRHRGVDGRAPWSRRGGAPLMLSLGCVLAGLAGCRERPRVLTRPAAAVDAALQPERFAIAIQKIGRLHLRGLTRFFAGPSAAGLEGISTETDLWMDDHGNWRMVDINDHDGGREVVLHGQELAVALRYGKMIRRAAEEPEPSHLLQEGIGGPFAAWSLLRDLSTVDDFGDEVRDGRKVHVYKMTRSRRATEHPTAPDTFDRLSWRKTLVAGAIEGTVVVDVATGAPLLAEVRARYSMRRATGTPGQWAPMVGALEVRTSVEEIGTSPEIAPPEAEDPPQRMRTVPDERALLGGLARTLSTSSAKGAP
jgi:hypothetical protein